MKLKNGLVEKKKKENRVHRDNKLPLPTVRLCEWNNILRLVICWSSCVERRVNLLQGVNVDGPDIVKYA